MTLTLIIIASLAAFFISLLVTGGVLVFAKKHALLDHPGTRSMHKTAMPKGGGIGILTAFFACFIVLNLIYSGIEKREIIFLVAVFLLAGVSLLDDFSPIPSLYRIIVQFSLAGLVCWSGVYFKQIQIPGLEILVLPRWLGITLTLFFIVSLTNFFNFMDGMDGLSGTVAAINGAFFILFGIVSGQTLLLISGIALLGSCSGFLVYNWSPAKIFMGDIGSAPLGFILAVSAIIASQEQVAKVSPLPLALFLLLLAPFLFDTIITIFRRALKGENILKAHRQHFYQRADTLGFSHIRIVLLEMLLTLSFGAFAVGYFYLNTTWQLSLLVGSFLLLSLLACLLSGLEKRRKRDKE